MSNIPTLRPRQQQALDDVRVAFRNHKAVLLVAHTAFGKCLAKGTPVMLFSGEVVPVEDIAVGDLLMGPDSNPRRVESLARGKEMMYRITPTFGGDPYVVNESHIISLRRTKISNNPRYPSETGDGEIVNISIKDYLAKSDRWKHIHKGWRAEVDFPINYDPLPLPPYILGAWLGDGNCRTCSFTTEDMEIVDEVRNFASENGYTLRAEKNSKNSVNLHVANNFKREGSANNILRSLNVMQNKHIPIQYKTATRAERLELLAGIIDTDGYCSGYGYDLTLKSERLFDDVLFVARSLGFSCTKRKITKTCANNGVTGEYFQCHIGGHVHQIPCRLSRKQMPERDLRKNVLNFGFTVEQVGFDDYFGFEISGPDRLFLLGDFTVTHNTICFAYVVASAAKKGNRVLIMAHRQELISQISSALRKFGVEHGIISPQFTPNYAAQVQVASIATMNARFIKIPERAKKFDLVILDEAHHLLASNTFGKVYDMIERPRILGVTATPERADGKGLGEGQGGVFQSMVLGPSVRESIENGYLSNYVVYAPLNRIDLSDVKIKMGDFDKKALADRVDKPTITGNAVKEYARICPTYPTVVFCVSIEHCHHVAAEFQASGFDFRVIDGSMDDTTRKSLINGLGKTHLGLVSCDIISEGTDVPTIACAIFLRPTKSTGLYIQQAGRAIRPVYADGYDLSTKDGRLASLANGPKPKAVLIDCAGLTFVHGMIDEEREWSLNGQQRKPGKKKAAEPTIAVAQCKTCFSVFMQSAAKVAADHIRGTSDPNFPHTSCCPNCFRPLEVKGRKINHEEGELQEITPEMADRMRKLKRQEVGKARTLEELLEVEKQRGYKPGWARLVFQSRQRKAGVR